MERNAPLGSIIGFDAAAQRSPAAVNRGRRSTDQDGSTFAQVYDLAAYANSGSRQAALVKEPAPLQPMRALQPSSLPIATPSQTPAPTSSLSLAGPEHIAAERLYTDLTTGGSWLRVSDDLSGTVVMRLHDATGAPVRELSITELQGGSGPEVA